MLFSWLESDEACGACLLPKDARGRARSALTTFLDGLVRMRSILLLAFF